MLWFRTDLRLRDHPALTAAVEAGPDGVVPLLVLDDRFWGPGAGARQAYLAALLREFDRCIGGLHVVRGEPAREVPRVAQLVGAESVHVTADFTPYGAARDADVEAALGVSFVRTGSPYAVSPGRVVRSDGQAYQVFTPFFRAWQEHGWRAPAPAPTDVCWLRPAEPSHPLPDVRPPEALTLPPVGEAAAHEHWHQWVEAHLADYAATRDRPDLDTSSRMSAHLKWGTMHPRTLLADLAERPGEGTDAYVRELAFREFYADVLRRRPDSAFGYYDRRFEHLQHDEPDADVEAWKQGRTGFPIVDAGMRQLLHEGWMHNRVRMIAASFLVKDLHVEWTHGAAHFLDRLVDADLASNQHNWQWVAGSGTDAAPYFRIFNPVAQARRFDPRGDYVRRWVPELAHLEAPAIHEPWTLSPPPARYPPPLVDHAEERREALRRYDALRGR